MPRLLGINPTKAGRILLASLAFVFVIYMLFGASSSNKIELTESNLETVFRFSSNEDSLSKFSLSDYKLYSTEGQELYPSKECCIQLSQANIQKLSSKILERSTMFYQRNLNHLGDNIASWNLKSAKAENFLYYAKLFPAQNAILVVRYEKPEDVDHSALDSKVSRTLDSVTLNSLLAALNRPADGQNGAHIKFSTKYHKKEDEEIDNALKKLTFKNSKVQVLRGAGAKGVSSPPPDSIILERVLDAVIESFPEHGISLKITQSDLAILRGAGAQGTAGPPDDHSVLRGAGAQGTAGPPDNFILAWTAAKLVEQMGGLTVPITQLDVDTWTGISNSPWIAAGIPSYMHNSSWGYQPPSSGSEKVSTVGNDTTSSTGNDTLSISAGGNVTGSGNSSLTIDSSSSIGFGYTSETLNRTSLRGRGASGTQGPPDSMTVTLKKTDILGKVDSASASDPYTELLSKILDQNIPAEGTQVKTSVPEYLMLRTGHSVDLEGKINR